MNCIGSKLTKKYAWELGYFYKVREFRDGIDFADTKIALDLYKSDHKPSFTISLEILNLTIFDFTIYNVNHIEE